jgi:transcriptional regulator with XRE-family HTH domain
MGRPRIEITETMIAEAERLASRGLTKEQIAYCLGFSADTLSRREKDSAAFAEAIKKGKSQGIADVANALYESAMGGSIPGQIFFLKNRDPQNWKDKPEPYRDEDGAPTSVDLYVVDGRIRDEDGNPIRHKLGEYTSLEEETA